MKGPRMFMILLGLLGLGVLGSSLPKVRRTDSDRLLTRKTKDLVASSTDLALAEEQAMAEFVDTRGLAGIGCQYATQTIIILDNSYAIFDKELWLFKLLIKEIAVAFLRNSSQSRLGLVLATNSEKFYIHPNLAEGRDVNYIVQSVKSIQRVNMESRINKSTITALLGFDQVNCPCRYNLLLLTAPYSGLAAQLTAAAALFQWAPKVQRFAVGTRIAQAAIQTALARYVGCANCSNLQFVSECTPAKFLFLLRRLYPAMCQPALAFRDATVMTFQIDGMAVDDENVDQFVAKFLEVVSESTGVPREAMEVLDIRDSQSPGGEELHMRRLRTTDSLMDLSNDTLLDLLVLDSPAGLRESPFNIASKLETDLRNDFSPAAGLFTKELNGVPRVRKINTQRDPLFDREPRTGLTFQSLNLKSTDRKTLAEIFQK